jgi:hypothetical protein
MGVVDETVQDGVGIGGVTDDTVPCGYGELAGDDRRTTAVAVLEDFQQIVTGESGGAKVGHGSGGIMLLRAE